MEDKFIFTYKKLKSYFQEALNNGYKVITCHEYLDYKKENRTDKIIVNRVDIDLSCKKAKLTADLFNELNLKATFFIRLHADEYNPFSFENYRILRDIRDKGHEIGYHSEVIDQSTIWDEDAAACLKRDIEILNRMLDIKITGVASHGGKTGWNNLDFWKDRSPAEFDVLYEAYDTKPEFDLFNNSLYISDSGWIHWKCYNNGVVVPDDFRSLGEHCREGHQIIYSLVHPDNQYVEHCYE
ncbi:MAG: hypothetical protein ABIJ45_07635 [Candidatus Zixiibacteriota bacterium]